MKSSHTTVYVVIEENTDGEKRVKAVFKTKTAAQEAIEEKFRDGFNYEIAPRTLYDKITN